MKHRPCAEMSKNKVDALYTFRRVVGHVALNASKRFAAVKWLTRICTILLYKLTSKNLLWDMCKLFFIISMANITNIFNFFLI